MFIRVNNTPNSPRKSVQVIESVREGHKVSKKILKHVGVATNEDQIDKLKKIAYQWMAEAKLKRNTQNGQQSFFSPAPSKELAEKLEAKAEATKKKGRPKTKKIEDILPPSQVTLTDIVEEKRITEGVDEIASIVYNQLGFNDILKDRRYNQILKSIVLSRLVQPYSKHKLQKVLSQKFDRNYDLDAIYRMMDKICPKIDQIKQKVFTATQKLIPETVQILLFDVTTLYFESIDEGELRQFGYSKDNKSNTTQVVLALATNSDGLPLGYELFPGKKAEITVLLSVLEKWKKLFKLEKVIFIGDRGMFSDKNLDLLEKNGCNYVIAAKLRNMSQKLKNQILSEKNYKAKKLGSELAWVAEHDYNGRRLITSYKESRALCDQKNREKMIERIKKLIGDAGQTIKLIKNQGIKKYTSTKQSETLLDQAKIAADQAWDGMHGVITNLKEDDKENNKPEQILGSYGRLWMIEESFRVNKSNLKMRPIYHWKTERIAAHIALCYMTFAVLRHLQYRIALTQKISVGDIIETLLEVQATIYIHKKTEDRYRMPGAVSHNAAKIYKAFDLIRSPDATIYLP